MPVPPYRINPLLITEKPVAQPGETAGLRLWLTTSLPAYRNVFRDHPMQARQPLPASEGIVE